MFDLSLDVEIACGTVFAFGFSIRRPDDGKGDQMIILNEARLVPTGNTARRRSAGGVLLGAKCS